MLKELRCLGFDTGHSASPVIPPVIGADMDVYTMATRLEQEGVFVNPVVTPAVPDGQAMIRTSYMATHERQHLDRALEAFAPDAPWLALLGKEPFPLPAPAQPPFLAIGATDEVRIPFESTCSGPTPAFD